MRSTLLLAMTDGVEEMLGEIFRVFDGWGSGVLMRSIWFGGWEADGQERSGCLKTGQARLEDAWPADAKFLWPGEASSVGESAALCTALRIPLAAVK
jgi:hypothetical protein